MSTVTKLQINCTYGDKDPISQDLNETSGQAQRERACEAWGEMARVMTGSGRVQTCGSSDCSRLDCSGTVHFSHLPVHVKGVDSFTFNYCFGFKLNSCNRPVSMDFYIDLPQRNVSKELRIAGDRSVDLKGVEIPMGRLGKASPQLDFLFEKQDDGTVKVSIKSRVKVTTFGMSFFLSQLERTLVDEERIPALPCTEVMNDLNTAPPKGFKMAACHAGSRGQVIVPSSSSSSSSIIIIIIITVFIMFITIISI